MNKPCFELEYLSLFNPNYFERQNSLLHVFQGEETEQITNSSMFSISDNFCQPGMFDMKDPQNASESQVFDLGYFKGQKPDSDEIESISATIHSNDEFESVDHDMENSQTFGVPSSDLKPEDHEWVFKFPESSLEQESGAENTAKFDSCSKLIDVACELKSEKSSDLGETSATQAPKGKRKMFSRRKDVIIKTVLRKWRKFFITDLNSKTNYAKLKRKYGKSIFVSHLRKYLKTILGDHVDERTTAFFAGLISHQDLEASKDDFVSATFTHEDLKKQSDSIFDILYKYTHQKFGVFSQDSTFLPIFMHYYRHGSESLLKSDHEHYAGLEIIKCSLQASAEQQSKSHSS